MENNCYGCPHSSECNKTNDKKSKKNILIGLICILIVIISLVVYLIK